MGAPGRNGNALLTMHRRARFLLLELVLAFAGSPHTVIPLQGEIPMFGWALTFLVVALIAAVLGFGGIASFAVDIAKIIFFVAIVLFVVSAVIGLVRGRSTAP